MEQREVSNLRINAKQMKTALWEKHHVLGAKMVEFGGWEMPLSYKGILQEHLAVRERVGIFDVSHMGRVRVSGNDAEKFLDYLSTNKVADKANFSSLYTILPSEKGGCIDDVIIYREGANDFFIIVNASNRQKDLEHLQNYGKLFDVEIKPRFSEEGILAVQGPKAEELLSNFFREAKGIKPMHFASIAFKRENLILSRTGYTGADGFEIYAPNKIIVELWQNILDEGKQYGIEPAGLGARDTLRLEMGYALYGHEISDDIAPTESVSAWTVKWKKDNFLGKSALEQLEHSNKKRSEYGIVITGQGIAREGYPIYKNNVPIGRVTSGTYSPSLNKAIAIILIEGKSQIGDTVEVQIRNNRIPAKIVPLPFLNLKENNEIHRIS